MEVALVTTTIDRKTGEVISRKVKEIRKVDEDEFYRPLVEVLGDDFIRRWKGGELI